MTILTEYPIQYIIGSTAVNLILLIALYMVRVKYIEFQRSALQAMEELAESKNNVIKQLEVWREETPLQEKKEFLGQIKQKVPSDMFIKFQDRFDETWEHGYFTGIQQATGGNNNETGNTRTIN